MAISPSDSKFIHTHPQSPLGKAPHSALMCSSEQAKKIPPSLSALQHPQCITPGKKGRDTLSQGCTNPGQAEPAGTSKANQQSEHLTQRGSRRKTQAHMPTPGAPVLKQHPTRSLAPCVHREALE